MKTTTFCMEFHVIHFTLESVHALHILESRSIVQSQNIYISGYCSWISPSTIVWQATVWEFPDLALLPILDLLAYFRPCEFILEVYRSRKAIAQMRFGPSEKESHRSRKGIAQIAQIQKRNRTDSTWKDSSGLCCAPK